MQSLSLKAQPSFENLLFVAQCVCFDLVIVYELNEVALRPMIPQCCCHNVEGLKLEFVTLLIIICWYRCISPVLQ